MSISPAKATILDSDQCLGYGAMAANISILESQGATTADILALLDNPEFKTNPEDIQRLTIATVQFVTTVSRGASPEEHFEGASNFCLAVDGDVEKMISALHKVMGTEI